MKIFFKSRIIKLLYELRWTFTSVRLISSTLAVEYGYETNMKSDLPTPTEIIRFLQFLKKKGIVQTKVDVAGQTVYQLKKSYHKPEEIELEIGI